MSDPNDPLVLHQRDITQLPMFTPKQERHHALKVQASRKRYHLAAFRLEHVARTLMTVYEAVRNGDLTLLTWGRMATSELVCQTRYQEIAGKSAEQKKAVEQEKLEAFRRRLDVNLPTARALLSRCRVLFRAGKFVELNRTRTKIARLLYELGVKTQKIPGLIAQAEAIPAEEQNETGESLTAAVGLARRREEKHNACKKAMAEGNLRLVWAIAKKPKFSKKGHGLLDLIGEGHTGLMRAVEKFDPGMRLKFSTPATYWIERSIKTFLGEQRNVRIPTHTREVAGQVHWARAELTPLLGEDPAMQEIVDYIREKRGKTYSVAQAEQADRAMKPEGFLDTDPNGEDAAGQSLSDDDVPVLDAMVDEQQMEAVHKAMALLPYRERMLLHLRLGFGDGWRYTLGEIGHIMGGVTREAVRLWEKKAFELLRKPAVVEILSGHL